MNVARQNFARGYALLAVAIAAEVTGSVSLRGALEHPLLYLGVAAAFLTAFVLLAAVLRAGVGIGVAYGIWGASGVALTTLASWVFFDEPLTGVMWLGIGLIIAGVMCIELGSQAAKRRRSAELSYRRIAAEYTEQDHRGEAT